MTAGPSDPGRRLRATACRICAVGCGTLVDVDGDRVLRVVGDPNDPWSHGYTCAKGRAAPAFHHAPDRLNNPLRRTDNGFEAIAWDAALDDIAATIREIIATFGRGAIADYTGTGGPLDPSGYAMAHGFFRRSAPNSITAR